jgi:CoA:oxalate CoA-transferase
VPEETSFSQASLLNGLTVVDLTQHLSGPFATQILTDLGARVIKVEPPQGDPTRKLGPHFMGDTSAYFLSVNRTKESVCVDLKAPGGREAMLSLVSRADVVVENFRPGTLERLGLGYDALVGVNPRVVLCSITGFGQDGPYRDRPAFDIIVQALSGGMSLTGEEGGHPVRSGLPIGDLCAGMFAATGILGALLGSRSLGRPSHIDVSMLDTQVSMLSYVAAYFLIGGQIPGPQGRGHMSIPTYRAWACRDGRDVVTAANTDVQWRALCTALGREGLCADPRFATNDLRRENKAKLYAVLEPAIAQLTSRELLDLFHQAGVPAAPINSVDHALADPQVLDRQMVIDVGGDDDAPYRLVGNPIKVRTAAPAPVRRPPLLGEHTRSVFSEFAAMGDEQLDALFSSGALISRKAEETAAYGG